MSQRIIPLRVSGYHIIPTGDADVGSTSAASVLFRPSFDETWDGMSITAKFSDASAAKTIDVLLTNDRNTDGSWNIPMPHEITENEGDAELSFVGLLFDDDKIVKHSFSGTGITGVTIDEAVMMEYDYGTYTFTYNDNDGWLCDGDACDIADYGITVEGTEADGDKIVVTLTRSVLQRQTTKPFCFRIYESNASRTGDNTEPVTASDRDMLFAAIHVAQAWATGDGTAAEDPSPTNNAKYYSEQAAGSASDASGYADDSADYADVSASFANGKKADGTTVVDARATDNASYYNDQAHAWVDGTGASSGDPQYTNHALYYSKLAHKWATGSTSDSETPVNNNAKKYAQDAATAKTGAETARDSAKAWAVGSESGTASDSNNAKYWAGKASDYADDASDAASEALTHAGEASDAAELAQAWAVGEASGEPGVENNAAYWAEEAAGSAASAASAAQEAVEAALEEVLPITAENLAADAVETAKIKDGNVTTGKLAAKAVTTAKLDDAAVGTTQLADNAVTTAKITDGNVTEGKIAAGAVTEEKLGSDVFEMIDGKVNTHIVASVFDSSEQYLEGEYVFYMGYLYTFKADHRGIWSGADVDHVWSLTDGGIKTICLADKAVTTEKIDDGAVGADQLDATAVSGIISDAVTAAEAAILPVTAADLDDDAVETDAIKDGAVTTDKIASKAVTATKIDNYAIIQRTIADGAIWARHINAALFDALLPHESKSGAAIATDCGADGIPVKSASVTVTAGSPSTVTVNRVGKNLLKQYFTYTSVPTVTVNGSNYKGYKLQLPPGYYFYLAWRLETGSNPGPIRLIMMNGNTQVTNDRITYQDGTHPTDGQTVSGNVPVGTTVIAYGGAVVDNRAVLKIHVEDDDEIILYCQDTNIESTSPAKMFTRYAFEFIVGADVPTTQFPTTESVTFENGLDPTPFVFDGATGLPTGDVTTQLGENTFYIVPQESVTASLSATLRLDPTLVMQKLSAAITALGTT